MVPTESASSGLWEEVEDGLTLLHQLKGCGTTRAELLYHPGIVKHSKKTTGTTRASRPEWLEWEDVAVSFATKLLMTIKTIIFRYFYA